MVRKTAKVKTTVKKSTVAVVKEEVPVVKDISFEEHVAEAAAVEAVVVEEVVATEPTPIEPVESTPASTDEITTIQDVADYLAKSKPSFEEKIETLLTNGPATTRTVVGKLVTYRDVMTIGVPIISDTTGANMNFDLFNTLNSVFRTTDSALFKVQMDIVNMFFLVYGGSKQPFSDLLLARYDTSWPRGDEARQGYLKTVITISMLAGRSTRAAEVKKGVLVGGIEKNKTIPADAAERISAYYSA